MGSSTINQSIKLISLLYQVLYSQLLKVHHHNTALRPLTTRYTLTSSLVKISFLCTWPYGKKRNFLMLYDYLHISVLGAFNTSDSLVIRYLIANIGMYIVVEKYYMIISMKYKISDEVKIFKRLSRYIRLLNINENYK